MSLATASVLELTTRRHLDIGARSGSPHLAARRTFRDALRTRRRHRPSARRHLREDGPAADEDGGAPASIGRVAGKNPAALTRCGCWATLPLLMPASRKKPAGKSAAPGFNPEAFLAAAGVAEESHRIPSAHRDLLAGRSVGHGHVHPERRSQAVRALAFRQRGDCRHARARRFSRRGGIGGPARPHGDGNRGLDHDRPCRAQDAA